MAALRGSTATASPALWVPWLLLVSIGPLFFAVSAQAPLIQRWYAAATGGKDPYPLYAASNLGSFSGLLSYPLLVEPRLAIAQQSALWTGGYALLDCQFQTDHLRQFGVIEILRDDYRARLAAAIERKCDFYELPGQTGGKAAMEIIQSMPGHPQPAE